ncbi:MAG: hypothetical protein KDB68_02830 [Planctomycetes bacterium]|nr:hypothetical protein [Planctomycetota bacterium]
MIGRTLAIAVAALKEALRAKLSPLAGLLLLLLVPWLARLFGQDDPDTQAWLTRSITTEGLRVVLPLLAIVGGGFLLRPTLKRGWTALPARRSEYFLGVGLTGFVVITLAAGLFTGGGLIANQWLDSDLTVTAQGEKISKQRRLDGALQTAPGRDAIYTWANPAYSEELVVELPERETGRLRGTIEYQLVWTREAPPRDRSPVSIWIENDGKRHELKTTVQSRYRIEFEGEGERGKLVIQPTDPVLIVGTTPDRVRVELSKVNSTGSMYRLFALSASASLLCLALVMLVRSLSTSPTAVLAGLLLLATLTLLPTLAPASQMAKDRRAAVAGEPDEEHWINLEEKFDRLPQLYPEFYFDEFLAARNVPDEIWSEVAIRLLAALLLLPCGAVLFRARQIAK